MTDHSKMDLRIKKEAMELIKTHHPAHQSQSKNGNVLIQLLTSSTDDDPFASGGDSDVDFNEKNAESSETDTDSNSSSRSNKRRKRYQKRRNFRKQRKTTSVKQVKFKAKEKFKSHNKFTNIKTLLNGVNSQIDELSLSTIKLEQEICTYRHLPYMSMRTVYSHTSPPTNHIGSSKIFIASDKSVSVPTQNTDDVAILNEILSEEESFREIVSEKQKQIEFEVRNIYFSLFPQQIDYVSVIFGTKKRRATWAMAKKILLALISQNCLANFTWTGKSGTKGSRKMAFKQMKSIHRLIVMTLKKVDPSYDEPTFHGEMVNHILKYAYLRSNENYNDNEKGNVDEKKNENKEDV